MDLQSISPAPEPKVRFNHNNPADFFPVLNQRIERYFRENNVSRYANGQMIFKTIFIFALFYGTYGLLLSNLLSPGIMLVLAIINGFFAALIGLNIGHDAIHGSYSSNKTTNKFLSLSFNLLGASDYMWRIMHNVLHHTYTNIPGHDDDINQMSIMRVNPAEKLRWIHRYQYIYIFFFYPLATLSWVFIKDYAKFFSSHIGSRKNNHPAREYFRLFLYKLIYYTMFIVIPMVVIDLPWYYILLGFLVSHFVEGLTLALVFQLAHVVEGPSFPSPDAAGKMNETWAVHQLYTTADFARKSKLATFIFGGLNFQIEHHLFPRICHIHYPKLSPIVEKTAREFGLPFYDNRTYWGAIASHVRTLKRLGRE